MFPHPPLKSCILKSKDVEPALKEMAHGITLPPNTTHITQPLDRARFAPLKSAWREACHRFITNNPGKAVTHYDFNKVFAEVWYKAMTMCNVIQSFKVTGMYPFNRMALPILQTTAPKPEPPNSEPPSSISTPSESEPSSTNTLPKSESAQASPHSLAYDVSIALHRATSISKFLTMPLPPCKLPTKNEKSAGLVLTSEENLRLLKKKKQAKEEKAREKEETSNTSLKTRGAAAPRTRITWESFVSSEEPSLKLLRSAKLQCMNFSPISNCQRSKSAILLSRNIKL